MTAAPYRRAHDGGAGDEAVAELMAQHGGARHADVETIAACLGRRHHAPPVGTADTPEPDPARGAPSPS